MNTPDYLDTFKQLIISGKSYLLLSFQILVILCVGYFLARSLSRRFHRFFSQFKHVDETLLAFLTAAVNYSLLIVTVVICLGKLGIPTTSIVTMLGAAGLAVGLALQNTLSNIAAGMMILFLRPFKIGEYIETGDIKGTIEMIGLFCTELKDANGLFVIAPNSHIWKNTIVNHSRNKERRLSIPISISHKEDLVKAKSIILNALAEEKPVLSKPSSEVLVGANDSSGVNLQVRCWVSCADSGAYKAKLLQKLKETIEQQGIRVPFPQSELSLLNEK